MNKKLLLLIVLLSCLALFSSCAMLPLVELLAVDTAVQTTGVATVSSDGPTASLVSGDTVTISRAQYERYQRFDAMLEIMDTVDKDFYLDVDHQVMLDGAAAGMLSALNEPYTFYYDAQAYADYWEDDEGEYAGVGMQITSNFTTQLCTISRVFKGSPAEAAGVRKGDILYQVEDLTVHADNINDAVDIMRGTPGTSVHVVFLRGEEKLELDMLRAKITINRVSSTMLDDRIGLIQLYEFAGDCGKEFAAAVDELSGKGMKGLIIDLRDNPGGWLTEAKNIVSLFVDEGTLCYLEYKDGSRQYYYTRAGKKDIPLVILMNENSASASELSAGCLQERANATVVGTQSYGKGIVQNIVGLPGGAGMQLTVAQYFTPNGNAVHKIGITPDVECPLPEGDVGDYDFADPTDPQLQRAIEVMQEKLN